MADYSKMTDGEFTEILEEVVGEMTAAEFLMIPGVYELVREELNNEVLSRWEALQEELEDDNDDD